MESFEINHLFCKLITFIFNFKVQIEFLYHEILN